MKLPLRRIISMRRRQNRTEPCRSQLEVILCLEEDGYVLDYYDTVNDLSKCISKSILDQTNVGDIFFLNHEYFSYSEQWRYKGSVKLRQPH